MGSVVRRSVIRSYEMCCETKCEAWKGHHGGTLKPCIQYIYMYTFFFIRNLPTSSLFLHSWTGNWSSWLLKNLHTDKNVQDSLYLSRKQHDEKSLDNTDCMQVCQTWCICVLSLWDLNILFHFSHLIRLLPMLAWKSRNTLYSLC